MLKAGCTVYFTDSNVVVSYQCIHHSHVLKLYNVEANREVYVEDLKAGEVNEPDAAIRSLARVCDITDHE
eukprot:13194721-Heterocapsa_arctica.AAC.1